MAKKKAKAKTPADQADNGKSGKKSGGGFLSQIFILVALGAASFGTVFMLPGANPGTAPETVEEVEHEAEVPELDLTEELGYLALTPLTISLQDDSRILKIGITLETLAGEEEYIDPSDPKIRDAFMGYLRALRMEQIEDPAFMAHMRAHLLRRAQLIFGAEKIRGILITDFLVR